MFFIHAFGSPLPYELPMSASPVLDSPRSKNGYRVGSMRLTCGGDSYFIAANRKLTNHLKSGILAAMIIYRDKLCGAESWQKIICPRPPKNRANDEPPQLVLHTQAGATHSSCHFFAKIFALIY